MKKILLFCTLIFTKELYSAIGCMDKSYHGYKILDSNCEPHPIDYKTLYYVECDCPCERYPWDPKYMRCVRCRHYGKKISSDRWPIDQFD
ncbi:MAG: hypothetical protein M1114_03950 [Candidatus Dependentiae bacterium]|nr:hypothetical protein [Candidatus Dependentiae bacterium]